MKRGLALALWAICGGFAASQPAAPMQTDLFVAGAEGYHTFRIPSVRDKNARDIQWRFPVEETN